MNKKTVVLSVGCALALGLGLFGGAAYGSSIVQAIPWGITVDGDSEPMPAPTYATTKAGETYGSAAQAPTPELEPDLIDTIATNGLQGYVRKSELDEASGATAAASFRSPEEALKWQEEHGLSIVEIPVYSLDGEVIGVFEVGGGIEVDPQK